MCINDLIERASIETNTTLKPIPYEKYFAMVFNEIEKLYQDVQLKGTDGFLDLYYKYWLHR